MSGITTGVLGSRWRASVTPWGAVEPWDGERLDWYVAADDRWHTPADEPAVRQERVEGTPVVETRLRIPNGDAVQRIWSVPDHGGLTIVEIENASPLAIAVAFNHGRILSVREPNAPIEGISLPADAVAFPVGHHATLTVAIAHAGERAGALPAVPPMAGVVRGWLATAERASRLLLPDPTLAERVVATRCELALAGPEAPNDDPVGFAIGLGQLVRMGEMADPWLPDLAMALERAGRNGPHDWAFVAALDAADLVLAAAGEDRARRDLASLRAAAASEPRDMPAAAPDDPARFLAWVEARLATADGRLLASGWPADWAGANFEVYGLPTTPGSRVSYAVRWHGARPAVLWEQEGDAVALTAPTVAPDWASREPKGETLWPAPAAAPGSPASEPPPFEGGSFS